MLACLYVISVAVLLQNVMTIMSIYAYKPVELPQALATMNFDKEHDPNLYADSGATAYIVNDPCM